MEYLLDGTIVAATELFVETKLGHVDLEAGSIGKVDARGVDDGLATAKAQHARWVSAGMSTRQVIAT